MPVHPQNVTITKEYGVQPTFSLSTINTYYPTTGLLNTTGVLVPGTTSTLLTTTTYLYNTNGTPNNVTTTDGNTRRTNRFGYDANGIFVTDKYNALSQHTQYTYDGATGNVLTKTAPNGNVTSYTYMIISENKQVAHCLQDKQLRFLIIGPQGHVQPIHYIILVQQAQGYLRIQNTMMASGGFYAHKNRVCMANKYILQSNIMQQDW